MAVARVRGNKGRRELSAVFHAARRAESARRDGVGTPGTPPERDELMPNGGRVDHGVSSGRRNRGREGWQEQRYDDGGEEYGSRGLTVTFRIQWRTSTPALAQNGTTDGWMCSQRCRRCSMPWPERRNAILVTFNVSPAMLQSWARDDQIYPQRRSLTKKSY